MQNKFLSMCTALLIAGMLHSCANQDRQTMQPSENSASSESVKSTDNIALDPIQSERRKMIKEADMRLRVADVPTATVALERSAIRMGGVVMHSQMSNTIGQTKMLPYNTDSLQQANAYTTTAYLQVRIPVIFLDSFLSMTTQQAAFVHSRNINQQDATLQYLSNEWNNEAAGVASTTQSKKQNNQTSSTLNSEEKINRKIENLAINDDVKYTTISLDLYQPEKIDYLVVANVQHQMQAGFGSQLLNGLQAGWQLLRWIFVGMVHIWPLLLIGGLLFFIFWNRKQTNKKTLLNQRIA